MHGSPVAVDAHAQFAFLQWLCRESDRPAQERRDFFGRLAGRGRPEPRHVQGAVGPLLDQRQRAAFAGALHRGRPRLERALRDSCRARPDNVARGSHFIAEAVVFQRRPSPP